MSPHQIVLEERPAGAASSIRRIQSGFDVDVYGVKKSNESGGSLRYELGYRTLQQMADTIRAGAGDSCSIEAIPYRSTTVLDTKNHIEALATAESRLPSGALTNQSVQQSNKP